MEGTAASCLGCKNDVLLALTDRGAMLPLEPEPSETGGLAMSVPAPGKAPRVRYLRGDDTQLAAGEERMRAHWDTHPACKRRRKDMERRPRKAAHQARPAITSPLAGRQDMTLEQLETANLDALVARFVAPQTTAAPLDPTFSSSI